MKRIIILLLIVALATQIVGCTEKKEEVIRMGFVPMQDGDKLIESVEPLTEMLSKELGVKVEGFTATNYVGVVEGLGSGQVDFGFIPPFAYVLANQESNAGVILTALNKSGEGKYRSQFLVRKDSEIKSFSDIKGRKSSICRSIFYIRLSISWSTYNQRGNRYRKGYRICIWWRA